MNSYPLLSTYLLYKCSHIQELYVMYMHLIVPSFHLS